MAKVIFENDLIKVTEAEHGCKPFVTIENKTNERICVHYDEPNYNDNYDPILIEPNHFAVLLENEEGRDWIEAFKVDWFYICGEKDESDSIVFRSDLEDIQNEVDRILNEYRFERKVHEEQVYNSNQLITVLEILKKIKRRRIFKMTDINNILNKIENHKVQAAERAEQERIAEERYRQNLLDKIQVMKPDIDNLIKVAKAAQEAGISLESEPMTGLCYEDGDFFTDAMTHKIGFVKRTVQSREIIGVGFEGGGYCGNYDFFTDGIAICDRNRDNSHNRKASTEHLEKFIEKFPEFEEMFYIYIEEIINL